MMKNFKQILFFDSTALKLIGFNNQIHQIPRGKYRKSKNQKIKKTKMQNTKYKNLRDKRQKTSSVSNIFLQQFQHIYFNMFWF